MSTTPHDTFFKQVFSRPEHAAGAFRAWLPAPVAQQLEWSGLAERTKELLGSDLTTRYCDLMFAAPLLERDVPLVLLHEHQSAPDGFMAARASFFAARAQERWWRDHPRTAVVPAVMTLVLNQGPARWADRATELVGLYDLPDALQPVVGRYAPGLTLLVVDLADWPDETLAGLAATELARLAWLFLKHGRLDADMAALVLAWPQLAGALRDSAADALAFASYTLKVTNTDADRFAKALGQVAGPGAQEVVMTTAEKLRQEGRREGRQEGRQEGRRELLVRQLRWKFPGLPADVEARVGAASAEQLDALGRAVMTAETWREALACLD